MKVSALIFLCIVAVTVAVAIPVQPEYGADSPLTLVDLENEQHNVHRLADENANIAREKRFILSLSKKIALAKLAHLGLGALGIAGAAIATKGVLSHVLDFQTNSFRASPRLSYSYPSGAYRYNQYFR